MNFLEEMKHETFEKFDAFTVGEVFNMKEEELREFIGEDGHFSSMFDFSAHELTYGEHGWYDARPVEFCPWREILFASQKEMEGIGFKANIIENHDERGEQAAICRNMRGTRQEKRCLRQHQFCCAAYRLFIRDRKSE